MGMDGINGFGPLIQQVQPQVKTQINKQNQTQSEVADYEVSAVAQNMDLTVEAADNTAGSNNESSAQNFANNQSKRA